eukprot:762261_1
MSSQLPEINPLWVIAMISCGGIGVIIHILITLRTLPLLFSSKITQNGKILTFACILVFIFNGMACLIWLLFRTNLLIPISIISCKFIYVTNFLFYFIAKYILHCVLIGRTYLAFIGTPYQMKSKLMKIYVIIVSLHFFITISFWARGVFPNVLKGVWMEYSICTLFSENAQNTFTVKLCAILVGAEDFIVGSMTLYIILKRFLNLSNTSEGSRMVHLSIRYGIVACVAMVSTLFLFTLAIPFWPNVTFIIAIDATINSLCVFCVLSVGSKVYNILCFPFRCVEKQYFDEKAIKIIIHGAPVVNEGTNNTTNKTNIVKKIVDQTVLHKHIQLQSRYS